MVKNKLSFSFTLIELLIVVTIIFIFSGLSLAYYNNFTQEQLLKNEAKKFVDVLEITRKKTATGDLSNISKEMCSDFNGYKEEINNQNYTLYICCNNDCSSKILIKNYFLSNGLKFESTPLSFQFLPLSAGMKPANSFPLNICLKNTNNNKFNKIIIEKSGVIKFEESLRSSCP